MNPFDDVVRLCEQHSTCVSLSADEAAELCELGLLILPMPMQVGSPDGSLRPYSVAGNNRVGHFRLRSGRVIYIQPKISIHNVFSLLAASYRFYTTSPFRKESVSYDAVTSSPLEALVTHLTALVEYLLQDGLLRRYTEREDQLTTLRGSLLFAQQISQNLVRPDRLYCRFSNSEVDNRENQALLWTLLLLQRSGTWSRSLRQTLQAQILRLGDVSIRPLFAGQFPRLEYDRLSARYEEAHQWCRMFVDCISLSDKPGRTAFRGYLLNMYELFERFVRAMFERAAATSFGVRATKQGHDLDADRRLRIVPDITVTSGGATMVIDAKYKVTESTIAKHPDLYQVIAYCNALGLIGNEATRPQGLLVYPASERTIDLETAVRVITTPRRESGLTIKALWIDLDSPTVLSTTGKAVVEVLNQMRTNSRHEAAPTIRPAGQLASA